MTAFNPAEWVARADANEMQALFFIGWTKKGGEEWQEFRTIHTQIAEVRDWRVRDELLEERATDPNNENALAEYLFSVGRFVVVPKPE